MNRIFKHSRRADDRERGATAVLVAVSLLVLIGFAAIAVDSGIAYADRRQQQSAADVGALAALQFAKTSPPATHPDCASLSNDKDIAACRGAEEALAVIEGTLPGRYSDADWDACTDPSLDPADYSQVSFISPCINFTSTLQRARVVLPGTDVATTFARVIGFDSIRVGAFAEAGLEMDIVGGVMPFALGPSGLSSSQACFMAQSTGNLNIDPCTGPTQGNFGKLDLRTYGNENYGTPKACSGQQAARMAINIVTGSDHPMVRLPRNPEPNGSPVIPPPDTVNDNTNCDIITNPVNQIETWPGNAAGALADGFFNGIPTPALEGRLMCKDGTEGYPLADYVSTDCVNVNTNHPGDMDHTPLWEYIRPGATSESESGGACAPGGVKNRAEMVACLDGWKSYAGPHTKSLFTSALATSPRFGGVPLLESDPGTGTGTYYLTDFLPVYIETIYLSCTANRCETVHSPGEISSACPTPLTPAVSSCGWPSSNAGAADAVKAVTAFILTMDMLPADIADNFPYQDGTIVYNLSR